MPIRAAFRLPAATIPAPIHFLSRLSLFELRSTTHYEEVTVPRSGNPIKCSEARTAQGSEHLGAQATDNNGCTDDQRITLVIY